MRKLVITSLSLLLKPYNLKTPSFNLINQTSSDMNKCHVEESDVGISCFISTLPGFRGILKQRYSDFIVNEVDMDDKVVHLTSLEAPPQISEEKAVEVPDQADKSYDTELESFRAIAGDKDADTLKAFLDQIGTDFDVCAESVVLSPSSDKAHRTAVHNFFKEKLKFLVTDTIDGIDDSSKCIRVRLNSRGNNKKGRDSRKRKTRNDTPYDRRGSEHWPEHMGKFLMFHLYKENKETQEALGVIGKMLGLQPRSFGFAGTKDKRSVSTQRVTVFKQQASRIAALNIRLIGIKVGNFCHVNEGLLLGQLNGNHFTITLRGVVADSEDIIRSSADALGRCGFINYFGLQRFGSGSVPTHHIGAALLRGEWKSAVELILDPRESDKDEITRVRELYKESRDIERTLKQLPRYMVAERAILQCLRKYPENYLQALQAIPRTLRMMYVHSYQSYLWNHTASLRVQTYGHARVVSGDLVYCKEQCTGKLSIPDSVEEEDLATKDTYDNVSEADLWEVKNSSVKVVDEEDLTAGVYTIEDVVLPLPGSRVIYPSNSIGNLYHDMAKKDGINLMESVHGVKEFSITNLTGGYRRVFQKPKDFKWELLKYTDGNIPLAETDLDRIGTSIPCTVTNKGDPLNGNKGETITVNGEFQSGNSENVIQPLAENNKVESVTETVETKNSMNDINIAEEQIALKLSFILPTSSYATMAIRELLKSSTSVAFHKSLNG
ncbi:hypothetical protein Leryth_002073 [Lithospermum erythrorhizon]|nr:hypothetical protein Leryth_002073 [Lithospermum erythrorhizon]